MCYRLLAAIDPPMPPAELRALAATHGLDSRVDEAAPDARVAEIAMGDCACSLYTRREGRLRVVALVDALRAGGRAVQLLLLQDVEDLRWSSRAPTPLPLETFREAGLQALPEGSVASLV